MCTRTLARPLSAIALAVLSLLAADSARASRGPRDGRLALDQVCVPIGCFPGDGPGWPIQITQPGAYVLTSNLDVTGQPNPANVTAVVVTAPSVDLDLGGFALRGPLSCSGSPLTCTPSSGMGVGVHASSSAVALRLHDGTITGFGLYGALANGDVAVVERVRFGHLGSTAVVVQGVGARLSRLLVTTSGGTAVGVLGTAGALAESSIGNVAGAGIFVGRGARLQTGVVQANTTDLAGVTTGEGSRIAGLVAHGGSSGIYAGTGSAVLQNRIGYGRDFLLLCDPKVGYTGIVMDSGQQPEVGGSGLSLNQNQCANGPC